jgi:protocatechuate 3,4-dioxygenase beta subunit
VWRVGVVFGLSLGMVAFAAAAHAPAPWLRPPRSWDVEVAGPNEPGRRFVMEGRLLASGDSLPMPGVTLFVYHVDRRGWYFLPKDSSGVPRLAATLRTDAKGRYRIRTILPGQYEGAPHVHFEAWGPDLPGRMCSVNLYMGLSEPSDTAWGRMGTVRCLRLDPERDETYVTRDVRGDFRARHDLRWDMGYPMTAHFDSLRRGLVAR